ncbi:baseplate J/gp47 family protein [Paenibacillus sp. HN-1]|uniref:baseplate J/gp47 family protein n=1 Tax=Paenibacillus TaxID=44249 RepID=UPI001CA8A073|nr:MULTISPECIES: baseplate J/gp47 family protein [Paenibacillus]MBY9080988.1 baseplate J/gp47 family protein [Paenibacillus sp. CGMCC 1.18879]MBY9084090.1 baseplate J/gp47 family protein [Paenibacillus sinensis]
MSDYPLYLQEQTEDAIMQRMLNRVPEDIDKSEGSFIWDTQAPVAFALSESAIWAQEILRRGFASTAASADSSYRSPELTARAAEHGVTRRAAVPAMGQVTFTGAPAKTIPVGTLVATPADEVSGEASIEYGTSASVTIGADGKTTASIQAVVAGTSGNVPAGVIEIIATPISGVTAVTNLIAITGGADEESDVSLLERYYLRVRNPGTSGNKAHYLSWATEIAGVGGVQVTPLWQGPGTVGIYLLDTDKRAANSSIVSAVQEYIDPTQDGQGEGTAPAGPIVTVMPAEEVPINISAQLTLAAGATLSEVKAQIEKGVTAYLKTLAFTDTLIRYTRIAAVMLDIPEIIDYSDLTVNGQSGTNIEVGTGEVAVLGTVVVS